MARLYDWFCPLPFPNIFFLYSCLPMRTVQPNYHILLRHFTLRTLPSNARRYTLITMHIDVKDLLI